MTVSPPTWRARLAVATITFVAVLVAAWMYVPDLHDAVRVVWGDAKQEAARKL